MTTTTDTDFAAWAAAARDVIELLQRDEDRLARTLPHLSGWSPLQHAAHLTLANERVLSNVTSLAKGSGILVVHEAAQNPEALALLAAGHLPRGRSQSPRMVVPPEDIDLERAREWAAQFATDLDARMRTLAPTTNTPCFVPHQLLGPLDLAQWIRFGTVHTRHHLTIAREILAG